MKKKLVSQKFAWFLLQCELNNGEFYVVYVKIYQPAYCEKSIHVVDGEAEDLGLAAELLAHLQHPVGHDLPHVGLDVRLHVPEVVGVGRQVPASQENARQHLIPKYAIYC